jgi:glycine/D-amino acid oxidase-like deaminating enzyme
MEARVDAPDVVIVGAGVVGAAVAYELARRGQRVLVLERAERAGLGASRWSLGSTAWLGAAMDPHLRDLCFAGLERHQALSDELGTDSGFRPRPILVLAPSAEALAGLVPLIENGRAHGFGGRMVDAAEVARLEPTLVPGSAVGGALCDLGWLDTVTATEAWLQGASILGATFRAGVEVRAIRLDGATPLLETSDGPISAGRVVLTAGAWMGRLLRQSGIMIPLVHTHAEILESEPLPPTFQHVVVSANQSRSVLEAEIARPEHRARLDAEDGSEVATPVSVELGIVQREDGRVRLGQLSRGIAGFLGGPDPAGEAAIRAEVASYFPALAQTPATLYSRPVSFSADRLPMAGPLPGAPNCWLISGLVSPLIYLPVLAEQVAGALAGEEMPALTPFGLERLALPAT